MTTETPIDPNDIRFFSGRSNPQLASQIAQQLGIPLDETHVSYFSNDNLFVQLGASVRNRIVYVVQSLTPPVSDHLLELLMMVDIAKNAGAKEIHAIIPYFSYARSDKKDAPRISITARLVANLLHTAGTTHVMTMTLHSPQAHGFFTDPTDHLTARGLFIDYLSEQNLSPDTSIVIAPDAGSAKSGVRLSEALGLPVAVAQKQRLSDSKVRVGDMLGRQIQGFQHAIFYDDEIATGGTVAELCRQLVNNGIETISVVCTHGLFLGKAVERLASVPQVTEIVTTDTVKRPLANQPANLTVLSTANVFAQAIQQNLLRQSIGDLFRFWASKKH